MQTRKMADYIRGFRVYLLGLGFLLGLLLGWMVIGWWFWPVEWINTDPWDLRPEHRARYVSLVATDYWQTGDVFQARRALAGWDGDTLAEFISTLEERASTPEARQHLAALREAMQLPHSEVHLSIEESSLVASLLRQKPIIWSTALSASPLVVAIILAVSPHRWRVGLEEAPAKRARPEVAQQRRGAREQQALEQPIKAPEAQAREATEQEIVVREVTPGQRPSESSPAPGQEVRAEAQQPETQQSEAQQPETQQPQERETDPTTDITQMQDQLSQMQDRLARLRETMPQMQQPVAQMQEYLASLLEQLSEARAAMPQMALPERQERMEQVQAHLGQMQDQLTQVSSELPHDAPPEMREEVEQMRQQVEQMMAQLQQQIAQMMTQMQQAGGPQAPAEPKGQDELDLQDLMGAEDILSSVFEEDDLVDPQLESLAESLEYIDIFDLSERCKAIAGRLLKHNSARSGPVHALPYGDHSIS